MLFLRCIRSILGRPEKNCPKQNNIYKTQQITEQIAAPPQNPWNCVKQFQWEVYPTVVIGSYVRLFQTRQDTYGHKTGLDEVAFTQ